MANARDRDRQLIVWLGAGASVTAGIPSGNGIVYRLLDRAWRDSAHRSQSAPVPYAQLVGAAQTEREKHLRGWASDNHKDLLPEVTLPQGDDWSALYFECLGLLSGGADRQEFIVECVQEGKGRLNFAHLFLAQLLANKFVRTVLTVNFDDLLVRALQLYLEYPAVLDAHSTQTILTESRFVQVVYLHGRLTSYLQRHTRREVADTIVGLEEYLAEALKDRGLLVVGYNGWDETPMKVLAKVLKNRGAGPGRGLYWVSHKKDERDLTEHVREILELRDTYWLPGWDADMFFEQLCLCRGVDLGLPNFVTDLAALTQRLEEILPDRARLLWREHLLESGESSRGAAPALAQASPAEEAADGPITRTGDALAGTVVARAEELRRSGQIDEALAVLENASSASTGLPARGYVVWGHCLQRAGRHADAVSKYRMAADRDPRMAASFDGWASALRELGRSDEAIEKHARAAELEPRSGPVIASWGATLLRAGRFEAAAERYQQATALDPSLAWAFNGWGEALRRMGCPEGAIAKYQRAIEIDPGRAWAFNDWGKALRELGRLEDALDKHHQAAQLDPTIGPVFGEWGVTLLRLGRFQAAAEKFEQATRIEPRLAWAFNSWGVALRELGRLEDALGRHHRAVEIDGNFAPAFGDWGATLLRLGRLGEAAAKYEHAATLDRSLAWVFNGWGEALRRLKRFEEAIAKYQRAVELDPSRGWALNGWAISLRELNRLDEALDKHRQAADVAPDLAPLFANWAVTLLQLHRYAEAAEKFEQAVRINPTLAWAINSWGVALRELGSLGEALEKHRRAIEIDPKFAPAFGDCGTTLRRLERPADAIEQYEHAAALDPSLAWVFSGWGDALRMLGRNDEAMLKYQRARELASSSPASHRPRGP